jgi:predicted nucleic acid-binding Zn ribbon protein
MPTTNIPLVLYVYRCNACGHAGELKLPESSPEVTTACSACGAEVRAEWDGGVELTTNVSE